jgi:hypothetical protein
MRRYCPLLLISLWGACDSAVSPPSPAGDFEQFWRNFDVTYSYFEHKHINWDSLRVVYRTRAEQAVNTDALIAVLREMTAPLRDGHIWFENADGGCAAPASSLLTRR